MRSAAMTRRASSTLVTTLNVGCRKAKSPA
jgi:hypothetical protein